MIVSMADYQYINIQADFITVGDGKPSSAPRQTDFPGYTKLHDQIIRNDFVTPFQYDLVTRNNEI